MAQPSRVHFYASRIAPFVLLTACTSTALNTTSLRKHRAADRKLHEVQVRFLRDLLDDVEDDGIRAADIAADGYGVTITSIADTSSSNERVYETDLKKSYVARSISLDPSQLSLPGIPSTSSMSSLSTRELSWSQVIFGERGVGAIREGIDKAAGKIREEFSFGGARKSGEAGQVDRAATAREEQEEWNREILSDPSSSGTPIPPRSQPLGASASDATHRTPHRGISTGSDEHRESGQAANKSPSRGGREAESLSRKSELEAESASRPRTFY
ncbi:hypothetical protein CBOM_04518 [Ceraceosorus bombacis]|uniref:Uncharacterized protein n=1 Tax=Ceraceosorus bombacis TaxID=401625 RepID=A0A0P1BMW5_9BASI|nr:hypothetical protein CBOM_04518 [Ceraceosorus bombacis]